MLDLASAKTCKSKISARFIQIWLSYWCITWTIWREITCLRLDSLRFRSKVRSKNGKAFLSFRKMQSFGREKFFLKIWKTRFWRRLRIRELQFCCALWIRCLRRFLFKSLLFSTLKILQFIAFTNLRFNCFSTKYTYSDFGRRALFVYTGWSINNPAIRNLNISAKCRPNELKFLPVIEAYLKFVSYETNRQITIPF